MADKRKNNKSNGSTNDWKSQLLQLKAEMEANMTEEEKQAKLREEQEEKRRKYELNKRRTLLYEFLAGYKQNSGIFINNFFRNRDFETYCQDKFESFLFDVSGMFPNLFDNPLLSIQMVDYLHELDKRKIAYFPINENFIDRLIAFSEVLDLLPRTEEDMVVYRGCSTLERNGVNGVVSTTTERRIAEQFSRGTILTIHVPKGTKCLNVKSIRPKNQQKNDLENEIILPPCDYQILSCKEGVRGRDEINNWTGKTIYCEMTVSPLDLLEEFLKMAENPPEEYEMVREIQNGEYERAVNKLRNHVESRRKRQNNSLIKTVNKRNNQ